MDIRQGGLLVVALLLAFVISSLATWLGCRWWYARKLAAVAQRLHKSDKGRAFAQQQTQQARSQIEVLKAELVSHQQGIAASQDTRRHRKELERSLLVAEREAAFQTLPMPLHLPAAAAHGFADTQILP